MNEPVSNALVVARIEALVARLDALAKKETNVVKRYWPIAIGILIALTRFIP